MSIASNVRNFTPGTTGWTVDDLDDPQIARQWDAGAYEIVEGVLTIMPPAYFDGSAAMHSLLRLVDRHIESHGPKGRFGIEVDLIVGRKRVACADAAFLTDDDLHRQKKENAGKGAPVLKIGRVRVAPTLVIESMSIGHEDHDRETKRGWYAQLKVPNYLLLNPYARSLECLMLVKDEYRRDAWGRESEQVRPSMFPGLVIPLADLWV